MRSNNDNAWLEAYSAFLKVDLLSNPKLEYHAVKNHIRNHLVYIGFEERKVHILPISLSEGDNILRKPKHYHWYTGSSLMETIFRLSRPSCNDSLRLVFHGWASAVENLAIGQVHHGKLKIGDDVVFCPGVGLRVWMILHVMMRGCKRRTQWKL